MIVVAQKFEKYLSSVAQDFSSDIDESIRYLYDIESLRINRIKKAIIILVKIYKGYTITPEEQKLLDEYPLFERTDKKSPEQISEIAYLISREAWEKANELRMSEIGDLLNQGKKITGCSDYYINYMEHLKEHVDALYRAYSYDRPIELVDPVTRISYYPQIDFDKDCLIIEPSNKFAKRISFIKKIFNNRA